MALRWSDNHHNIRARFKHLHRICYQSSLGAFRQKVMPSLTSPSADKTLEGKAARNQAIQCLKIGPENIAHANDPNFERRSSSLMLIHEPSLQQAQSHR